METITRDEAFSLLKKYNKDPFHIQHALTVEAVMKWYANELGYGEDAEYWGIVGLLPVSYTHLDVYKRQSLSWLEFLRQYSLRRRKNRFSERGNEKWLEKWQAERKKKKPLMFWRFSLY